jgi:hypothetical protein
MDRVMLIQAQRLFSNKSVGFGVGVLIQDALVFIALMLVFPEPSTG